MIWKLDTGTGARVRVASPVKMRDGSQAALVTLQTLDGSGYIMNTDLGPGDAELVGHALLEAAAEARSVETP